MTASAKKRVRARAKKPDRFAAVGVLFLRVLQRDSTEAPAVLVSPGKGSTWVAAVFIGPPPANLLEHYLRGGSGTGLPVRAANIGDSHRVAVGESGDEALRKLEADLRDAIAFRLAGDLGAWFRAYGTRFRPPKEVATTPTPADPHAGGDFPARPRLPSR